METLHPPWIWLEAQEGHHLPEAGGRVPGHGGAVHHQGGAKVDLHIIDEGSGSLHQLHIMR